MKNIYRNLYNDQKDAGNLAKSPRIRNMTAILNQLNPQNNKILDIGCHDGTFLSLAKNRNNDFYGVEASVWAAQKAREKGIDVQETFFDGTNKLPYEDEFFNVIVAGDIIEHIYDTDFFLSEIRRILKPKGKLLISTPNIASLGRRLTLFLGLSPIIELSPNEPVSVGHIRYFTFESLKNLLKKHKFEIAASQSDCVNFSKNGKVKSLFLAKIFPKLGASIICLARKKNN